MNRISRIFLMITVLAVADADLFGQTIPQSVFAQRRRALMNQLQDGVAVFVPSRSGSGPNSNFYYLTGVDHVSGAFILNPDGVKKYILFLPVSNARSFFYSGQFSKPSQDMRAFAADTVLPLGQFDSYLRQVVSGARRIYLDLNDVELHQKLVPVIYRQGDDGPKELVDLLQFIHEMRVIKDEYELAILQNAIDITCEALLHTFRNATPGMYECEIQAMIEYQFRKNGAQGPGFTSIIGAGRNGTILHYEANQAQTKAGDLVVMDVGAEVQHYTADVTRTIPLSGRFDARQKDIYEIVLKAHQTALSWMRPGNGMHEGHIKALQLIASELQQLGLITDPGADWQVKLYLPYNISHWLGLDVHDVGRYDRGDNRGRVLEPGMVLTVEPGIYIRQEILEVLPELLDSKISKDELDRFAAQVRPAMQKYDGIGIRIEDDVLITKTGCEILSQKVPITIEAIEKTMRQRIR